MKLLDRLFEGSYEISVSERKRNTAAVYSVEISSGNFLARYEMFHEDRDTAVELCCRIIADRIRRNRNVLERYYPGVFSSVFLREEGASFETLPAITEMAVEELDPEEALLKMNLLSLPAIVFRDKTSAELTEISRNCNGELNVYRLK